MIFGRIDEASTFRKAKKPLTLSDAEFGVLLCKRSAQAKSVRVRVMADGSIRATLPPRAPLSLVRDLVDSSRQNIRDARRAQQQHDVAYTDGMRIGHSHTLRLSYEEHDEPQKKINGQELHLILPMSYKQEATTSKHYISSQIRKILRREAMAYLPRRLQHLAHIYGFHYERERFGNQTGRWASCSSSGTISLNVALMNVPLDLIDYVLIHELAHTVEMNHSPDFWQLVEDCDPDYKTHRKMLKQMSPIC
jgi:predicted metal-dependent hydrolase